MKWSELEPLLNKYAVCPDCGNKYIGNGKGAIEVKEDYFKRTCKCGFEITVSSDEEDE